MLTVDDDDDDNDNARTDFERREPTRRVIPTLRFGVYIHSFHFSTSRHARLVVESPSPVHHCRRSCRLRLHCRRGILMMTRRGMRVADGFGSASGSGVGGAWSRVAGVVRWSRVIWHRGPLVGSVVFGHCPSCFGETKERMVSQGVWRLGDHQRNEAYFCTTDSSSSPIPFNLNRSSSAAENSWAKMLQGMDVSIEFGQV